MAQVPVGPKGAAGPLKEINTQKQGRTDAKVGMKPGPATGRGQGNPTSGGGINRATKSKGA